MASPRKNLTKRSNTSSKSSGTQTENPQNGSQTSTQESDETSTQKTTEDSSSSTPSEEDSNEALFADADAEAAERSQSDDQDSDEDQSAQDAGDASEDDSEASGEDVLISEYGVRATGDVHEFTVRDDRGEYSFKGHVQHNIIIVAESAWRELGLPGTSRTTRVLVHHRGQTLPLASYRRHSTTLDADKKDDTKSQED